MMRDRRSTGPRWAARFGRTPLTVCVLLLLGVAGCVFDPSGLRAGTSNDNNDHVNGNHNGNHNAGNNNNDVSAVCGDGRIEGAEACDDGNAASGDGCGSACLIEPGWVCTGEPSLCALTCGNGAIDAGESCDDGNAGGGDGCSEHCQVEPGWDCGGPSCVPICGDGLVVGGEACDDGNLAVADGCAGDCTVEPYFACDGAPSQCHCVFYVNGASVPQPRTGASWEEAYARPEAAIAAASAGCEVWVAQGTYHAHHGSADDSVSLKSGVAVYGGFAGGETALWQRDWDQHPTVLHGADAAQTERVYHVVTADNVSDAVLSGFTVTRGDARYGRHGGGIHLTGSTVSLHELRVEDNFADLYGGGIYAYDSTVSLQRSVIANNEGEEGGGVDASRQTGLTIDRCRFTGNVANLRGGGLRVFDYAWAEVRSTLFASNTVNLNYGGAVLNWSQTSVTFVNCTFHGNQAPLGAGAIRNYTASGCAIHNSIVWGNAPEALDDVATSVSVTHSVMQDAAWAGSNGNLAVDPLLLLPGFTLDPASPCIDVADDALAPPLDLDGNLRVDVAGVGAAGTLADMGALEHQP